MMISQTVENVFPKDCWVIAETSDVRRHSNGHCYLEFIEKDSIDGTIIAKARGYIWANTFSSVVRKFEQETGRRFDSGLKVLVSVSVEFHPLYGYGLNVSDIDATYTLGDLHAVRQEILRRLKEDGILTANRELELPALPQRIAVISSASAAGYEDFVRHLSGNRQGFVFYPCLFRAMMQGEQTERSVIDALERVFLNRELFDVVVIIRGGGAASELSSFDTYPLAAACAQFPLPVITGIGHDRDDTVLDCVAFHSAKTPTAVADFLIEKMGNAYGELSALKVYICREALTLLETSSVRLDNMLARLHAASCRITSEEEHKLEILRLTTVNTTRQLLRSKEAALNEKASFIRLSSPEYVLSKGYSITRKNGKALKSTEYLMPGDTIDTVLAKGTVRSEVI
jgi:exodeoxyribonuclease VII large subunit